MKGKSRVDDIVREKLLWLKEASVKLPEVHPGAYLRIVSVDTVLPLCKVRGALAQTGWNRGKPSLMRDGFIILQGKYITCN